MIYFKPEYYKFFNDLSLNNNHDWFKKNQKRYKKEVKKPFRHFVDDLIHLIKQIDSNLNLETGDSIFRISYDNRDKNLEEPYKLYSSCKIAPNGRKDPYTPGFNLKNGHDGVEISGGLDELRPRDLKRVRKYISEHTTEFRKLIRDPLFISMYDGVIEDPDSEPPRGIGAKYRLEPLIKNKTFRFKKRFDKNTAQRKDFLEFTIEYYLTSKMFNDYFEKALA